MFDVTKIPCPQSGRALLLSPIPAPPTRCISQSPSLPAEYAPAKLRTRKHRAPLRSFISIVTFLNLPSQVCQELSYSQSWTSRFRSSRPPLLANQSQVIQPNRANQQQTERSTYPISCSTMAQISRHAHAHIHIHNQSTLVWVKTTIPRPRILSKPTQSKSKHLGNEQMQMVKTSSEIQTNFLFTLAPTNEIHSRCQPNSRFSLLSAYLAPQNPDISPILILLPHPRHANFLGVKTSKLPTRILLSSLPYSQDTHTISSVPTRLFHSILSPILAQRASSPTADLPT